MDNLCKIRSIFWTHFLVAAASHIFVVLIVGGVFKLLVASSSALGFWEKGLMLGVTFYTAMYATNHITNSHGFCFLTDIENFYRRAEGIEEVGPFTPRFYKKCRDIGRGIARLFNRRK